MSPSPGSLTSTLHPLISQLLPLLTSPNAVLRKVCITPHYATSHLSHLDSTLHTRCNSVYSSAHPLEVQPLQLVCTLNRQDFIIIIICIYLVLLSDSILCMDSGSFDISFLKSLRHHKNEHGYYSLKWTRDHTVYNLSPF